MANHLSLLDKTIFDAVNSSEAIMSELLGADVLFYYGEIVLDIIVPFRNFIEKLKNAESPREIKGRLAFCLKTPGGQAEAAEKIVEIVRHHYQEVYFIVPDMALSAGTMLCMSGDKIYMDYASSLGPIDPQVLDKEEKYLVPALGYLDKVSDMIEKSRNNTLSSAEFVILEKQDLAMLRFYEQARDLSEALLREWLIKYKFKDWTHHRRTNPGKEVTQAEREKRAGVIANALSDNKRWHSHARMIGMRTLIGLGLEVDDLEQNNKLHDAVRIYSDTLCDYLRRSAQRNFLYSRHL